MFKIELTNNSNKARLEQLADHFKARFAEQDFSVAIETDGLSIRINDTDSVLYFYLSNLRTARERLDLSKVQPAHEITPTFASGAMSMALCWPRPTKPWHKGLISPAA
ncbi:hypothetical protein [Methylomonas koyamae]|uniref:hypothetical protein n=1 Tax=Methylomonas koyamae TaxID=702114 RepID=UPI000B042E32|nr:hypothetical protein [Methylomonas koyamae]